MNGIGLPAQLSQLGFQLLRLPAVFLCLGSQCIDLSPTGKNGSVFIHRAAGQAAARIHHLTVQRYRAVAVAVRLGNGGRRINILGHNGAAQQRSDHLAVTIIALHQFTGKTHIAAPRRHVVLFYRVGTDIGQRQEGRPSGAFFFQVHNGTLCRTLVLHHDVLDRCAQCDLHGSGIPVLGLNQAGDRADNSPQGACARLLHYKLDAVIKALIVPFQIGKHLCALQLLASQLFAVSLPAFQLGLFIAAAFQLVQISVFTVLQALQAFPQLIGKCLVSGQFLPQAA